MKLDILVPVKNEADNLPQLVFRIDATLASAKIDYQIIFIDDHSTDKTLEIARKLAQKFPVRFMVKEGKPGKAYSVIEGATISKSEYVVMIDADLQYPPEAIPEMIKQLKHYQVVIADRKVYKSSLWRRFVSRFNAFFLGRVLLGIPYDVQSGLKLFKRDILAHIDMRHVNEWSLDMPLLHTARELGYKIGQVPITYELRQSGRSSILFYKTTYQIVKSAVQLRLSKSKIYQLTPTTPHTMIGAGIAHKRKRFITHTTLSHHESALQTFIPVQKFIGIFVLLVLFAGFVLYPFLTLISLIALLSVLYLIDVFFSLFVTNKSLHTPPEIQVSDEQIANLKDAELPIYSILCPLYHEAHVVPQFLRAIENLNWPKNKLDVLILLEEDDIETINRIKEIVKPSYVRLLIVPQSMPKTKPKACNFGLSHAKGKYVVVYDAEDIPDPDQLKKAHIVFASSKPNVLCLQAKLNYYNPHHNLLTRLFTVEYSLWFDIMLPGLQSIETTIPLGGTSNHFKTTELVKLGGWDPFNVAEDCDLGMRLFKAGYRTAIIDSVTLEEATSNVGNWIRQRSRWLKGYFQTLLVHNRKPYQLFRRHGIHAFIFQLVVGLRITFMLINPLLWMATISYFALYAYVGPFIESLYPTVIFYIAATSLVLGNFMYLYNYMIGAAKRGHWSLIKFVFIIPFYWLMVSYSACIALFQLLYKPHYWEKTNHGVHLMQLNNEIPAINEVSQLEPEISEKLPEGLINRHAGKIGTSFFFVASFVVMFLNILYNIYLGREMSVHEFGTLSLLNSFLYLGQIFFVSLSRTITKKSAYVLGRHNTFALPFWKIIRAKGSRIGVILVGLWLVGIPTLAILFKSELLPFITFSPVYFLGILSAVDNGFLSGSHKFFSLGIIILVEAVTKLLLSFGLMTILGPEWVYIALPASQFISVILGWFTIKSLVQKTLDKTTRAPDTFNRSFFLTSLLFQFATVSFISFDVILAKYFLDSQSAGLYSLMALTGKMIFFSGGILTQFMNPWISRLEGRQSSTEHMFTKILLIVTASVISLVILLSIYGENLLHSVFGDKIYGFLPLLPFYSTAIALFTISSTITLYHHIKQHYIFPFIAFGLAITQIIAIWHFHSSLEILTYVMVVSGVLHFIVMVLAHLLYQPLTDVVNNASDFAGLFSSIGTVSKSNKKYKILVFNWRDTKHIWAGGAELYIHELSSRWVNMGHHVTVFCGNDGKHARNEVVNGVQIVRRGGFYTVYIWAFLYYILRFRGLYDIVVDSENGIPFFTPLFVLKPKILLIHHVHQKVFAQHLPFPIASVAAFAESKLIPLLYQGNQIVTVSQSSKNDIIEWGLGKERFIEVVSPGVTKGITTKVTKSKLPLVLYLGRLKAYKNIDVLLSAFVNVLKQVPTARLIVAGEGEEASRLRKMSEMLGLSPAVEFLGRVSDEDKQKLYANSWIAVQPSSFEGWGITVIEANAKKTPVVAANVNGLKDSVIHGKTGLLVPVRNPHKLSEAIVEIISNTRLRDVLSENAFAWASQFSWETSSNEFIKIIENRIKPKESFPSINTRKIAFNKN